VFVEKGDMQTKLAPLSVAAVLLAVETPSRAAIDSIA